MRINTNISTTPSTGPPVSKLKPMDKSGVHHELQTVFPVSFSVVFGSTPSHMYVTGIPHCTCSCSLNSLYNDSEFTQDLQHIFLPNPSGTGEDL
jgi:hypothetical protein